MRAAALDGVQFMDYDAMTYSFSPSVDALAEFKVETSTYSAEAGGAPGGQVTIVTKRGGNDFRGRLWEFNRNDALTQTYNAIGAKEATSPRLNRNQYGANIGGPVWIPEMHSGTDRTFFFFNWESGRLAQGAAAAYRRAPTDAQRTGDLRGLVNARTFTPTMINEFRAGWHKFSEAEIFGTTNDPDYDIVGKMGLPLVSRLPKEFGPPTISINGNDGAYSMHDIHRQISPRDRSNGFMPFTATLSWQHWRHFVKNGRCNRPAAGDI